MEEQAFAHSLTDFLTPNDSSRDSHSTPVFTRLKPVLSTLKLITPSLHYVKVDETENEQEYPGYTPLHFI